MQPSRTATPRRTRSYQPYLKSPSRDITTVPRLKRRLHIWSQELSASVKRDDIEEQELEERKELIVAWCRTVMKGLDAGMTSSGEIEDVRFATVEDDGSDRISNIEVDVEPDLESDSGLDFEPSFTIDAGVDEIGVDHLDIVSGVQSTGRDLCRAAADNAVLSIGEHQQHTHLITYYFRSLRAV